jgi:2-dehydro-3-deoxyglucarate aldolase
VESYLKQKLRAGELTYGTFITSGSPNIVDMLCNFDFDWLAFDMEHSPISIETVSHMIQVLNGSKITPLVRVGHASQENVKLVLDSGAHGIFAPPVNSRADAERAVSLSKYPPRGTRGAGLRKATNYGLDAAEYFARANDETVVIVQMETQEAIDNLDEILGVEGVDVAFVGMNDLSMSLGLFAERSHPRLQEALTKVVKACATHDKTPGIIVSSGAEAKKATNEGFRFISLSTDMSIMVNAVKDLLGSVGRSRIA